VSDGADDWRERLETGGQTGGLFGKKNLIRISRSRIRKIISSKKKKTGEGERMLSGWLRPPDYRFLTREKLTKPNEQGNLIAGVAREDLGFRQRYGLRGEGGGS